MRFKRLNDNRLQILISNKDLLARNMKKWDLAPHSPHAQELFQEILDKAAKDCDFEVLQDTQLIVEAYPITGESLLMTITKVNDTLDAIQQIVEDDILKLTKGDHYKEATDFSLFQFTSLENIIEFALAMKDTYLGDTAVYKEVTTEAYLLKIEQIDLVPQAKIGWLHEYATEKNYTQAYLNEHCKTILSSQALDKLKLLQNEKTALSKQACSFSREWGKL